jgi:hypothetical protein
LYIFFYFYLDFNKGKKRRFVDDEVMDNDDILLEEINCDDEDDVEEMKFGVKVKMITKSPKIKLIINKSKKEKEKKKENNEEIITIKEEEEGTSRMTCLLEEDESYYKENRLKKEEQIALIIDRPEEAEMLRACLPFIDPSKQNLVMKALMYSCFSSTIITSISLSG